MTYTLHRLAAGSYDLVLGGVIVGSVVRELSADGGHRAWHVELLEDPPPDRRPIPFTEIEHAFPTLDAVTVWLGAAMVLGSLRPPSSDGAVDTSATGAHIGDSAEPTFCKLKLALR